MPFVKMILYFIGVYLINRISHGRFEIQNFSSRVEKYARPCNILYLLFVMCSYTLFVVSFACLMMETSTNTSQLYMEFHNAFYKDGI